MATLSKDACSLLAKYCNDGGTDITGFGVLGHIHNLAQVQINDIDLVIHTLPVIKNLTQINDKVLNFKLR